MHTKHQHSIKTSASLTGEMVSEKCKSTLERGRWIIKCSVINLINLNVKLHDELLCFNITWIGIWTWNGLAQILALLLKIYTLTHCPSRGVWWCDAWPRGPDPGSGDQIASAAAGRSAHSSRVVAYRRVPLYASVVERTKIWIKYGWEFMKYVFYLAVDPEPILRILEVRW